MIPTNESVYYLDSFIAVTNTVVAKVSHQTDNPKHRNVMPLSESMSLSQWD